MSRADDDDYDDRPRRRRRRDDDYDDYDDRPRRAKAGGGGGAAVWIAVGLVVGLLLCCGLPVAGWFMLMPAASRVRDAAARVNDQNGLKQIGLGAHSYHDVKNQFFPADGDLSWRVHILPYVEQGPLYNRFDLTRPWDAPGNRPLAAVRVPAYVSALDPPDETKTRVRVFTGPGTLFPPGERPLRIAGVTDGTSNTLLAVEAAEAVTWTEPRELAYSKAGPLPAFGHPARNGFHVLMADGVVRFVRSPADEAVIRQAITPNANDGTPKF